MEPTDKIWRLDPNGENRKILMELEPNQRLPQAVASDGTYLYMVIETVSQDASSSYSLYRTSIASGKKEKITDLAGNEFEVARGELVPAAGGVATGEWAVKDGWC